MSAAYHAALFAAVGLWRPRSTPYWPKRSLPARPNAAELSPEKLARIDGYFNNEVATGKIPGAMVLIKQHGRQVYFKTLWHEQHRHRQSR